MDLKQKFSPANLKNVFASDFDDLTFSDIEILAKEFPFMNGDLLIQKADGSGVKSPATYKSFVSLIKSGHKFKIVGTRYGTPKLPPADLESIVEKVSEVEFIASASPIVQDVVRKKGRPKKVIS